MIVLSIILQLIASFIGAIVGQKALNQNPNINFDTAHKESKPLIIISLILVVFFLFGALVTRFDTISELTPLLFQKFSTLYSWTIIAIFIGFVSGYALLLAYKLKRKIATYLPAFILLNILFLLAHNQTNGYIGDRVKPTVIKGKGVFQTTSFSCTSASIATIARGFKIDIGEKKAAELTRLTRFGADSGQIRYALSELNIGYETLNGKYKKLKEVKPPAIIFVDHPAVGYEGHAVVYLGIKNKTYKIWDPLKGESYISAKKAKNNWHGNGIRCFSSN